MSFVASRADAITHRKVVRVHPKQRSAGIQRSRKEQEGTTEQVTHQRGVMVPVYASPGQTTRCATRIPLLPRGDRNNPIAREPRLAERNRVIARSGNNNFAVLGGSAVTSSHEVPVVDLGRAGAEHRGRRVVARRREFDRPPDGGDVEIRRLRGPLSDIR